MKEKWFELLYNEQLIITRNDEINAVIREDNYERFPNIGYGLDSNEQKNRREAGDKEKNKLDQDWAVALDHRKSVAAKPSSEFRDKVKK